MADIGALTRVDDLYAEAERQFADWDVVKDVVDEMIDLSLNYRQSGHPGGSRSKVHLFLALLLSGAMRWDIRRPWLPFADRFVLSAGHTVPLVYATLAVLNETLRARHEWTGDARFAFPDEGRWALTWEDLPTPAPPRRPARARRDGGQDALPEVQHGPVRPRHAAGRGRGAGPQARRLRGRPRLRRRGRGRPHAGRQPRDAQRGLGPGPLQPRLPGRLERLRDRRVPRLLGRARDAGDLVRGLRLARHRHARRHGVGSRDARGAGGGPRREPGEASLGGLVPDPQGPRLRQVRRRQPRHAAPDERAGVLGRAPRVHGEVRRDLRGRRRGGPGRRGRARAPGRGQPAHRDRACCAAGAMSSRRSRTASSSSPTGCPSARPPSTWAARGARLFEDPRLFDYRAYPAADLEAARREGPQPGRAGRLGRVGQLVREGRVRPSAVHRRVGRPRRVDQPGRVRQGLRRPGGLGLVRARHQPARRAPAHRDHRVHQRRHDGRPGHGQPGRRPDGRVQRLLGRLLDLRVVQLPQVRRDAALQPAGPGHRAQGGQGALGRRALGPGDGRGLAHPLRDLRDRA